MALENVPDEGYPRLLERVNDLPQELKDIMCGNVFIEFLPLPVDGITNPVVLKINFKNECSGYRAVWLFAEAVQDVSRMESGQSGSGQPLGSREYARVLVQPLTYAGKTKSAERSVKVEMKRASFTLCDIIALLYHNSHTFANIDTKDKHYGSRDFM